MDRLRKSTFLERFNLEVGMGTHGSCEQCDAEREVERLQNSMGKKNMGGKIIEFSHQIVFVSLIPGPVCIWYFCISSESERV